MKLFFLMALVLVACSQKKLQLPEASTKVPMAAAKQFHFQAFPQKGNRDWLKPIDGNESASRMELDPIAFLDDGQSLWLAGAMREGLFIRRSFLFQSKDGKIWNEQAPASSSMAIVALSSTLDHGLAAIESYWTEGAYLDGVWVLKNKNWKHVSIVRKQEWQKDVFRKDLKCCSEMVSSFNAAAKIWELDLEGSEQRAKYSSRDLGKTWTLFKGSVKPLEVNRVLNETWRKVDWDGDVGLIEIQAGSKKIVLPKYWKFRSDKNNIYLQPIL